jgi:hypothetical protein
MDMHEKFVNLPSDGNSSDTNRQTRKAKDELMNSFTLT